MGIYVILPHGFLGQISKMFKKYLKIMLFKPIIKVIGPPRTSLCQLAGK
jgi:hypothetical protein